MIEYRTGNLLDAQSGVIVHGCNMLGVMGAGVAKAIKDKYPECYTRYKLSLESKDKPKLGDIIWYYHPWNEYESAKRDYLWIANALTQETCGGDPTVRYVNYVAVANVFRIISNSNIEYNYFSDVHFPKIGAGLANGDWNIIEQIINDSDPHDKYRKVCWVL